MNFHPAFEPILFLSSNKTIKIQSSNLRKQVVPMLKWRVPWWMYLMAAVFLLTFFFNARLEWMGPANAGWIPSWPSLKVAGVVPGSPMEKAGLRPGDVLEFADGQPLTGMPDWFIARAHFERDRPIAIQIRRGEQHLQLQVLITTPGFRTWNRAHARGSLSFYVARFLLLVLAIFIAFSRPWLLKALFAALMLAVGAVAEGYPSSGWAAALGHLPVFFALAISVASASCLLSPMIWLLFCATFSSSRFWQQWRLPLALVPIVFFGIVIVTSAFAMIYTPSALARPWPLLFSAAPVRFIQDTAGVAPLLYLNRLPFYRPATQTIVLEFWLAMTLLYFMLGFGILAANYSSAKNLQERRHMLALCLASVLFGIILLHNFLTRNWGQWFGMPPPAFFSGSSFVAETILFPLVPLAVSWCVLARPGNATKPRM
jgi:hypothetical protein